MPGSVSTSDPFDVVIIGAGLAGLTAALHLVERGITPLVLEEDSFWAGGRLSGGEPVHFEYDGQEWSFQPDHGMHALWGEYHNMRRMLTEMLEIELYPSEGEVWINRWENDVRMVEAGSVVRQLGLPAPFHYLQLLFRPRFWQLITLYDFLSLPGVLFSILMTVGIDPIQEEMALDGISMDEYFHGWTANLKATFVGLAANLLAAPPEKIPLTSFIAAMRFYTILRRDSWTISFLPGNSHQSLIEPMMEKIRKGGGEIKQGWTATSLNRVSSGWRITVDCPEGRRSLYAKEIILAIQPSAFRRLLAHSPDLEAKSLEIPIPATVKNATIRLWFTADPHRGSRSGMFTGDFLPDNFFWLHRLFDEYREWHEATGGSVLEVHLYAEDSILDQPEKLLLIQVLRDVQQAWPALRGHLAHSNIRINSRNQPVFRVPTPTSLQVHTPWIGITACGDWIGYPHPAFWMERATVTGIAAANRVLGAAGQPLYPILEPRSPEPVVRLLGWLGRGLRIILGRPLFWLVRAVRKRR